MQRGPNPVAWRTPVQFLTGCGGCHRKSPTGGAANGMPLNSRTPDGCGPVPSNTPLAVVTRSAPHNAVAVNTVSISIPGWFRIIRLDYINGTERGWPVGIIM